jgi:GT2 family glycosyltransferase
LTKQCLETVLGHECCETIVVDDGSTDSTPRILASFGRRIKTVTHATNSGFARSCNDGAAAAHGEYLVFLNNDTIPTPGWLRALVRHADCHPEAAVVGAKLLYPNNTIQHAGVVICQDRYPRHIYTGFPADHPAVSKSRAFQVVTGACMLARRHCFAELRGFDTAFRNGFEDVDFCLRLCATGAKIHYCADSVVLHFESVSPGRFKKDRSNVSLYRERWLNRVHPDDLAYYIEDSLLNLDYEGSYPCALQVSPMLAVLHHPGRRKEMEILLEQQSRELAELRHENAHLLTELGRADGGSHRLAYERLRSSIKEIVRQKVPKNCRVLVISKGDRLLLDLDGREAQHFPQTPRGVYAGHHPADSAGAIAHLEDLRGKGADHLLVPATSAWWLEYYKEFQQHLRRYRTVSEDIHTCLLYDLRQPVLPAPGLQLL